VFPGQRVTAADQPSHQVSGLADKICSELPADNEGSVPFTRSVKKSLVRASAPTMDLVCPATRIDRWAIHGPFRSASPAVHSPGAPGTYIGSPWISGPRARACRKGDRWSMSGVRDQLPTLLGILVGVLATFAATSAIERSRWRRENSTRWDGRRVDAYAEFSHAIKAYIVLAQRMAAARGLGDAKLPIDPDKDLHRLVAAEERRGTTWEQVLLLGDERVIEAGRDWIVEAWRLEWFARGLLTDEQEWRETETALRRTRAAFYSAARRDLGVSAAPLRPEVPHPRFPGAGYLGTAAERPAE
jgi:hypothetical protein